MDILTLSFYGLVCGTLACLSPTMKNRIVRITVGVLTGLLAAAALPLVHTVIY